MIPRALTIAGSAAQGSAGIQADLKTFQERDVYGMAAITAIVANNPITDQGIFTNPVEAVEAQYYTAVESVGVDALKTGMLFTKEIIEAVTILLKQSPIKNIVVDPVMIGKMGSQLLKDDAIEMMRENLFPLARLITPNLHEAERILEEGKIHSVEEMKEAAVKLYELGPSYVLVKGGSHIEDATDVFYDGRQFMELTYERFNTIHTSGAGCSYSAAITAELARNKPMDEAVQMAKAYVTASIKYSLSFEKGIGSTYHAAYRKYGI